MIITFDRRGFANNSSSSHSIIFSPDLVANDDYYGSFFGWEHFTCASKQGKAEYLFASLCGNFGYGESHHFKEWCVAYVPDLVKKYDINFDNEFGVDHQSRLVFPSNYQTPSQFPCEIFFRELFNELVEKPYFILGGNDNGDNDHVLDEEHRHVPKIDKVINLIGMITDSGYDFCVKDTLTKEWILSNRGHGDILKFLFSDDITQIDNLTLDSMIDAEESHPYILRELKASFPYLVDLKITDYCDIGCPFCYQSSTENGQHADANFIIDQILPELKKANVFEIVLGGGEPTKHPHIKEICAAAYEMNFKVGITSKNFYWWLHEDLRSLKIQSLAFSCQNLDDIKQVQQIQAHLDQHPIIYVQIILELHTLEQLEKMILYCHECRLNNITFLGYKSFGFGEKVQPKIINSGWITLIKKLSASHWIKFGIDSVLVKKYKSELLHHQVEPVFLVGTEGKQTCYVDAVNSLVAASSFTANNIVPYQFNNDEFLEIFSNF